MLFSLPRRFLFLASASASLIASSYAQRATITSIPQPLSTQIPQCARSCVLSMLDGAFPSTCSGSDNLSCLCSHYSTGGLTLGEIALGCIFAACSDDPSASKSSSVYLACSAEPNAVSGTHTVLTVTYQPASATSTPTLTASLSSSPHSAAATAKPTATASSTKLLLETLPPTKPTDLASTTRAPSASPTPGPLSPAQIIGVSVAGAATLILVVGALITITCLQKRRDRKHQNDLEKKDSLDFSSLPPSEPILGRVISPSPPPGMKDPRGGTGGVGVRPRERSPQHRLSAGDLRPIQTNVPAQRQIPNGSFNQTHLHPESIGVAISPEADTRESPDSMQSERTLSRLLPEKPSLALSQSQVALGSSSNTNRPNALRINPAFTAPRKAPLVPEPLNIPNKPFAVDPRPNSVTSQITVFEEDKSPVDRSAGANVPAPFDFKTLAAATVPARVFGSENQTQQYKPYRPPGASFTTEYSQSPESIKQPPIPPPLSLNIPQRASRLVEPPQQSTSPMKVFAPPAYASPQEQQPYQSLERHALPAPRFPPTAVVASSGSSSSSSSRDNKGYLPRYYTRQLRSNSQGSPKIIDVRGPPPNRTHSNSLTRTSTRTSGRVSAASYTTFESADPEEPTPPEEEPIAIAAADKHLTPVEESSPISNLRYPKIPRASNQVVPRTPPLRSKTPSPEKSNSPSTKLGSPFNPKVASKSNTSASNAGLGLNPGPPFLSTPTRSPNPSTTLLAKRRGDQAAQDLEKRLWVQSQAGSFMTRSSNYSQSSFRGGHSRGHSRTGSDGTIRATFVGDGGPTGYGVQIPKGPRSAEMAQPLKSPLWVPRITPTRRGEDLFLSIS
jgi:hypothetical protein